jgi:phage protein D
MISATAPQNPNPLPPFPGPAADPEPVADELHIDTARNDEPLTSGPEWRRRKFGLNPHTEINQRSIDAERAQVMADALYRKRAREFLKIDTVTIGLPRLRAGKHVEYRGMRPPFDGFYYVEKSEHTYGDDGLRTHFTARRPGMPFRPTQGS